MSHSDRIDQEVQQLKKDIARLGTRNPQTGKITVKFGVLFDDEAAQQYYEALVGTLKAAKKRGILEFPGQMLLKGAHDDVEIVLLEEEGQEGGGS